jgi:hypothetical protein
MWIEPLRPETGTSPFEVAWELTMSELVPTTRLARARSLMLAGGVLSLMPRSLG